MINKKLTGMLLAVAGLGLVACGPTDSTESDDFTQKSDWEATPINLQVVGNTFGNWTPSPDNSLTLEDGKSKIEFKFAFNDTWGGDLAFGALDPKSPAYSSFTSAATDKEGKPDASGNLVPVEIGTYHFEYRYWYAMDKANYSAQFQVSKVTA